MPNHSSRWGRSSARRGAAASRSDTIGFGSGHAIARSGSSKATVMSRPGLVDGVHAIADVCHLREHLEAVDQPRRDPDLGSGRRRRAPASRTGETWSTTAAGRRSPRRPVRTSNARASPRSAPADRGALAARRGAIATGSPPRSSRGRCPAAASVAVDRVRTKNPRWSRNGSGVRTRTSWIDQGSTRNAALIPRPRGARADRVTRVRPQPVRMDAKGSPARSAISRRSLVPSERLSTHNMPISTERLSTAPPTARYSPRRPSCGSQLGCRLQ